MRHSRADELVISIYSKANQLHLDIKDNGGSSSASPCMNNVVKGNGLKGIEERMSELNGTATFSNNSTGFHTLLILPEAK